ncbi:transcription factor IIF subunit tfg1 [Rhodotorula kratochvilovae]
MERKPKVEPMDGSPAGSPADSPLPTGGYHDFILRASAPSSSTGTKYNVMKFAVTSEDRVVDPQDESQFLRPVKLNRKDPRTVRRLTDEDRERHNQRAIERAARAAGVKMEVDGEGGAAVKGEEGAADAAKDAADAKAEKEELDLALVGKGAGGATNVQRRGPGGMFKKKTRRVFVSSEEARRLKREEWQPWVLEDDEGRERWIGRLEGGAGEIAAKGARGAQAQAGKNGAPGLQGWRPAADSSATGGGGSAYVAFVLSDNNDEFRVLPVNRWYRFNQGPKYLTLAEEEAEEEYARQQKSKDPERWVMHRRIAPAAPAAASGSGSGVATPAPRASTSSSNGGGSLRSRMLANSAAGTRAPDSGGAAPGGGRPLRAVITSGAGGGRGRRGADQGDDEFDYEEDFQDDEEGIAKIDDLADEQETKELEERIRREMRAVERPDEIPDDDDDAAEQARLNRTGKEIKKLVKKSDKSGAYESDDEEENPYASDDNDSDASAASQASGARPGSRAASPSAGSARGASTSRPGSRAASPASGAAALARRAASPGAGASKRKRGDDAEDGSKRRKGAGGKSPSPAPGAGGALLTPADLIGYLRARPAQTSTTKDLLKHFGRALKDKRNKEAMGGLLKAVADFKDGSLVLKAGL